MNNKPENSANERRRIPPGLFTMLAVIIYGSYLSITYWRRDPFYHENHRHWLLPILTVVFAILIGRAWRGAYRKNKDE